MKKPLVSHTDVLGLLIVAAVTAQAQQTPYFISNFAGSGGPQTPVAGLSASVGQMFSVAADTFGNIYFGSDLACVFKQDSTGILTRVAGTCRAGFSGDGGPATQAQLGGGRLGVAVDAAGTLYIADSTNQRVRKVSPDGTIATVAGGGQIVSNGGDGGLAAAAQLRSPVAIAFDSAGNMYIGEGGGLRKIVPDGTISTIAGGDIGFPYGVGGVAIDSTGNIFVTEPERDNVRKISPAGVITSLEPQVAAAYPQGLAIDSTGTLYIADHDNNRIVSLSPSGTAITVAGSCGLTGPGVNLCKGGFAGDGGFAVNAVLGFPYSFAVGSGKSYVADTDNHRIRQIANGIISTIAGNGSESYSGDGGPAGKAQLGGPSGAAFDSAGNLYFADSKNDRIRKISPAGIVTTIAGIGIPGFSGDGKPAIVAQLNLSSAPDGKVGVAFDPAGSLYITDIGNTRIRKVTPDGIMTTAAAAGGADLAVDGSGNIFFVDSGNIRKISPSGIVVTVTAGTGPLAMDSAGNLYYSDTSGFFSYNIREISPSGASTLVVQTSSGPFVALAPDSAGGVYFATSFEVMKVPGDIPGHIIAGNGSTGYAGDGGPALRAPLNVSGLAVGAGGKVYITDAADNAIRVLTSSQAVPAPSIGAVTNGASNLAGPIAPGEIVVLYGANMGPSSLVQFSLNAAGLVGTSLAGTQVFFNGIPAPILYTSAGQVAAVVPYMPPISGYEVIASYQGQTSQPVAVPFAATSPALITADATGLGQAAAVNQNGSLNSAVSPIPLGGVIVLYATGEGFTTPPGIDGKPAAAPLPVPFVTVTASIGGQPAVVQYAGGAPGFVAGLMQVNVVVPINIAPGPAVAVVLKQGPSQSQSGVTIAVAGN